MNDELRELYQEVIIDHGRRPRNFHKPDDYSHHQQGYNPLCGDQLELFIQLDESSEPARIANIAFLGQGCAISMASASLLTELLKGKTVAEAQALFDQFHQLLTGPEGSSPPALGKLRVLAGVREFPSRIKCATLAWHALKEALAQDHAASEGWVSSE